MTKTPEKPLDEPKVSEVIGSNDAQFAEAEAERKAKQAQDKNLLPESKLDQVALEASDTADAARAEAVEYWDAVYDRLKELKLTYEHTEAAPIKGSKLWALLASLNTAEE